ncbi:MAG: T9SS type A sorting domain-containing protein, partial [bacterium]
SAHMKIEKINNEKSTEILVADGTSAIIPSYTTRNKTELTVTHWLGEELALKLPPRNASIKPIGIFREFSFANGENLFPNDITIFFPYMDDNNDGYIDGTAIHENNLKIYYLLEDPPGNPVEWKEISIEKHINSLTAQEHTDTALHKGIYFKTNHFTLFAIMSEEEHDNLNEIIAYPNPARPNKNSAEKSIKFRNLTRDVSLKIFSLSGRLVREINDIQTSYDWDLSNAYGEQVQSGVYFYVATDHNDNLKKGKLAIIR